jgi:glyoxylate/hydroxypyruvate reductase A
VVTEDLVATLDSGRLKHAVLDVFEVEPLPADEGLWQHPSITILPHISAPTDADTAAAIVASNVSEYRSTGRLPATVDFARGY